MSIRKSFYVVFFLVLSISLVIGCRKEKTAEIFVKGASISGANGVTFDSENQLYIASSNSRRHYNLLIIKDIREPAFVNKKC